jgi:hypothetical protein
MLAVQNAQLLEGHKRSVELISLLMKKGQ